jgi:hypothetical protein
MKKCGRCHQEKDVALFGKNKRYSDGCWPYCKQCDALRVAKYREANPEKVKLTQQASRAKNPEKVAQRKKQHRISNQAKVKAARKLAYEANKESELLSARKYKKANPHVVREIMATRMAKKKNATPAWVDRKKIRELHADAAEFTALTGYAWHVDHIVPLKSDQVCGLHWHGNMQVISGSENQSKSNRHWPDMP